MPSTNHFISLKVAFEIGFRAAHILLSFSYSPEHLSEFLKLIKTVPLIE